MSPFFLWDEYVYVPFKSLPTTPAKELLWLECPIRIYHNLCQYVTSLTFPLPSILQVLLNAEPLRAKLRAYLFDTRVAEVPWFLTQGEVKTSHLRNFSLTPVLTIFPDFFSHLPTIVLLPSCLKTVHHGVIQTLVQIHFHYRPLKVIVMRAQALDLLRPIVSPIPLTSPAGSHLMNALHEDAEILLVYGKVRPHIKESSMPPRHAASTNNDIVVASEVRVYPAGQEGRTYRCGKVGWVNRYNAVYHGVINEIQGAQDERVGVKVNDIQVIQQSVRIQIQQILLLAASPHLYFPQEKLALDKCGIHGSTNNPCVVPNSL